MPQTFFQKCRMVAWHFLHPGSTMTLERVKNDIDDEVHSMCWVWGLCGCPVYRIGVKQAASFAATTARRELVNEAAVPFPVFGVLLDSKLFDGTGEFILVADFARAAAHAKRPSNHWKGFGLGAEFDTDNVTKMCWRTAETLADLSRDEFTKEPGKYDGFVSPDNLTPDTVISRQTTSFARVAVGLILSLDHSGTATENFSTHKHTGSFGRCLPDYTEFRFTRPIGLDVRPAIREWAATGKGALTVQTLVAGHWKMQVFGPERIGRKRIHLEPYWRGPSDGAVALRCPTIDTKGTINGSEG